jgi:hypothetical protein
MSPLEFIAKNLNDTFTWLKMTVADFSDEELMQRPAPNANHGNWNLGHILTSQYWMFGQIGAKMPELPAGLDETYGPKNTKNDDPKSFMKKAELLAHLEKVNSISCDFVKSIKPEDLNKDSPNEMRQFAPKFGDVILLQLSHNGTHLGQIQVLRRKLGKPVLF